MTDYFVLNRSFLREIFLKNNDNIKNKLYIIHPKNDDLNTNQKSDKNKCMR